MTNEILRELHIERTLGSVSGSSVGYPWVFSRNGLNLANCDDPNTFDLEFKAVRRPGLEPGTC
jgi:hypothetical protein